MYTGGNQYIEDSHNNFLKYMNLKLPMTLNVFFPLFYL